MNEDDYWLDALKKQVYRSSYDNDYTWQLDQITKMDSSLSTQEIYNLLSKVQDYIRKDNDMAYTYSRNSWYQDTRGDEVATATLEAYASGMSFSDLIRKNTKVRQYWGQMEADKVRAERDRAARAERDRKLAEKRAIEKAKREEVMSKLSPEELEAFGLVKKGKRK